MRLIIYKSINLTLDILLNEFYITKNKLINYYIWISNTLLKKYFNLERLNIINYINNDLLYKIITLYQFTSYDGSITKDIDYNGYIYNLKIDSKYENIKKLLNYIKKKIGI